jgi:hypothetical protein
MPMGRGRPSAGRESPVPGDEVPVLEEDQDCKIEEHRGRHRPPGLPVIRPPALHQHAVDVVNHDGQQHDENVDRLSPAIEKQAHQQQNQIPQLQRRQLIDGQHGHEIEKQKGQAGKDHNFSLL